jgi:hypothetical protein
MALLFAILGVVLIVAALRDIFQTLFHPGGGSGVLSSAVARSTWRIVRLVAHRRRSLLQLGGPLGFFAVLFVWVLLFVVGWALIYLPHLQDQFSFDPGTPAAAKSGFVTSFYFSMASFTTLGYGDITPLGGWLRLLAPLESLVGFGFLTASVTWLLSLYPALFQRRALADEIALVYETEQESTLPFSEWDGAIVEQVLGKFTSELVSVRGGYLEFPVVYYFQGRDEQIGLPAMMPYLLELCESVRAADHTPQVYAQTTMLRAAIDKFAATLGLRFLGLPHSSTQEILLAYAEDHFHEPRAKSAD